MENQVILIEDGLMKLENLFEFGKFEMKMENLIEAVDLTKGMMNLVEVENWGMKNKD